MELKACPFCGGEAFIVSCLDDSNGVGYYVACKNDNCQGEGNWDLGESGAIDDWNTRPLEDALRKQLNDVIDNQSETIAFMMLDLRKANIVMQAKLNDTRRLLVQASRLLEALRKESGVGEILSYPEKEVYKSVELEMNNFLESLGAENE